MSLMISDRRDAYGVHHVNGNFWTSVHGVRAACDNAQVAGDTAAYDAAEVGAHVRASHDDLGVRDAGFRGLHAHRSS